MIYRLINLLQSSEFSSLPNMECVIFLLSFFLVFTLANAVTDEYRTVETKYGQVRGVRKITMLKNVDFYSFRGIPYAKSPIGQLRFKVSSFSVDEFEFFYLIFLMAFLKTI